MSPVGSTITCAGCGFKADPDEPFPFRCPNAGRDDVDHVMTRVLDPGGSAFPEGEESDPFVRYRVLFHAYHLARSHGMTDDEYVEIVDSLDKAVAEIDGRGFTVTPFRRSDELSDHLGFSAGGGVWVKDETGNVSGSHKARHLMGLMILVRVVERLGLGPKGRDAPRLAIASCGNAALAAGVVARAADRTLEVFVPPDADALVLSRLRHLGARISPCPRHDGSTGDPTYHRLQEAVRAGALPFTCQGSDNGLTIEGGETLGYEMVWELARTGGRLDRLFVQVGGGALASACIQAFEDAARLGVPAPMPRIHAVQTAGGHPLERAYDRLADRILRRLELELGEHPAPPAGDAERADLIRTHASSAAVQDELRYARTHRSEFMWPWEEDPRSIAHGILDDETYDWMVVVRAMVVSGGHPVVVSEQAVIEANDVGKARTGILVDHTGSAGLAGLLHLRGRDQVGLDEKVAVLFTGIRR